jgi:hypothetical protein
LPYISLSEDQASLDGVAKTIRGQAALSYTFGPDERPPVPFNGSAAQKVRGQEASLSYTSAPEEQPPVQHAKLNRIRGRASSYILVPEAIPQSAATSGPKARPEVVRGHTKEESNPSEEISSDQNKSSGKIFVLCFSFKCLSVSDNEVFLILIEVLNPFLYAFRDILHALVSNVELYNAKNVTLPV